MLSHLVRHPLRDLQLVTMGVADRQLGGHEFRPANVSSGSKDSFSSGSFRTSKLQRPLPGHESGGAAVPSRDPQRK